MWCFQRFVLGNKKGGSEGYSLPLGDYFSRMASMSQYAVSPANNIAKRGLSFIAAAVSAAAVTQAKNCAILVLL